MSTKIRALALLLVLGLTVFAVASPADQGQPPPPKTGQQPAGQQRPVFRAGVNFVRVDVIVTDRRGDAVFDLQPGDFEVQEDGKPQKIETFKLVKLDGTAPAPTERIREIRTPSDEEMEAGRDDVRLFAILLDDYHVRRSSSLLVRDPLSRFVQMRLAPQDMVGLMYPLTPLSAVLLGRDRDSLVSAIQKFEGRKYDYTPRNLIEERYAQYPASVVERIRNDVTLSALKGLIIHLGGLREGRKAVILVSEGFTNLLPPQLRDPVASFPGLGNPARGNARAGENDANEERAAWLAKTDMQSSLREIYNEANRNNVAIYALDPRGLATNEFDINEAVSSDFDRSMLESTMDTLRLLADQTDGKAIVNRNDLDAGLRQIIRDSSGYYLIGYSSADAPTDGKFHEIKVRVKRPGVQVRARRGYWALTAAERATALAPPKPELPAPVRQALASIAEPPRGRLIRSWLGTSRGENGRTKVTFVWEALPGAGGGPAQEPQRVALVASGTSREYFRGRVPETVTAPADLSAANPLAAGAARVAAGSRVVFDADPGRMQMRIAVEGPRAQVLDSEVRDIVVPDLTVPQVTLSTPMVFRARTVREFNATVNDPNAVPTAAHDFSRAERLLIRFEVYAPGGAAPTPTAQLLNRGGTPMTAIPVQPVPGEAAKFRIDLPLAALAASEYLIEISVESESGEATHLIAMRVAG